MAESNSKDQAIAKATKVIGILTQDVPSIPFFFPNTPF